MTPERHAGEDELVRANLHLATQAVHELARRLPPHVNRDDLSSAAMLGWPRRLGRAPTQAELGTDVRAVHKLVGDVHRATVLNYESIVAEGEADDLLPSGDRPPDRVLVDRERRAYLADAVLTLPERLWTVVIGSFYQERPVLEIANELGVTESRVSQLRAEALILLRDGLNAHLDPDTIPAESRPDGRPARRRAPTGRHRRLLRLPGPARRGPRPLLERAAEAGLSAPTPA
jgi:RNA polymerase sigma factor (sigma-70 family)